MSTPAAQHLVGIVAAHLFQICAEAVIVDVVLLEAGLELPCLIVNSELGDVADLVVVPPKPDWDFVSIWR